MVSPDRDTRNAAPWRNASALHTLVEQVCDREGITRELLDEVDNPYDVNEVEEKVNEVVDRTVLTSYADPSKYVSGGKRPRSTAKRSRSGRRSFSKIVTGLCS